MVAVFDDPRDHRAKMLYEVFIELPTSKVISLANNHIHFIFDN